MLETIGAIFGILLALSVLGIITILLLRIARALDKYIKGGGGK